MLYKYLFSILCGHLNLNKKNWIWPVTSQTDRLPVKPTDKPVQPAGKPVRTDCTVAFEFKFEFDRFRPVSGQTGPVGKLNPSDRSVLALSMTHTQFSSSIWQCCYLCIQWFVLKNKTKTMSNHLCTCYMVAISMTNLASTSLRESRDRPAKLLLLNAYVLYITWSQIFVECLIIYLIEITLKNSTVWRIF